MKHLVKLWVLVIALDFAAFEIFSQPFLKALDPSLHYENYLQKSKQINMYYDTVKGPERSGYKQWKRMDWFAKYHLDEKGNVVSYPDRNLHALEELKRNPAFNNRVSGGNWANIGSNVPGAMAKQGRVNSIAFDPVNGSIVYAATAGGGIWKTYNNGDTWVNLTIDLPILGIADIIVAPAPNNHIVFALTGDISGGTNVYIHRTVGVLKSTNGGATWMRTNLDLPLNQDVSGFKLLMHPTNPDIILASFTNGVYRTLNGGNTWTPIIVNASVNDIEFDLNNPDTIYCAVMGSGVLNKYNIYTFANRTRLVANNVDRMEIAVCPDYPNTVYALCGPGYLSGNNNLFNGLFYSMNSGETFTMRSNSCVNNGDLFDASRNLAWYANSIYVDPEDELSIIVGGLNLFRSLDGGINLFQVTTNSIHADQHNIKRNPTNGDLWLGNDGGIYLSTDEGITWTNKSNGLIINEYYRISSSNNTDDLILGGTQDNGHFLRNVSGDFVSVLGNDGMDNCINSYDNSIAYACAQNGGFYRSITYGTSFTQTALPKNGNDTFFPWIAPIVQHPPLFDLPSGQWINTDIIYVYAYAGIWRCIDGTTYTLMPGLAPGNPAGPSASLAICSDANGTTLYVSNGSSLWFCFNPLDANPLWGTATLPNLNGGFISSIAVNPVNSAEIWIGIAGYISGVKAFKSIDGGFTWSNESLSLPNIPVYSITYANQNNSPGGAVYIGTEIGVFYKDNNVPDWVPFFNALPHVPVTDLSMNYSTGELKAATYGRGIWETDPYDVCPGTVLVDFDINQGQYSFESSNLLYANKFITGGLGAKVTLKAAQRIYFQNGFKAEAGTSVKALIGNCGSGVIGISSMPNEPYTSRSDEVLQQVQRKDN